MNSFDFIIIIIILYFIIRGMFRGLIRETASISGAIAGFYIAGHFFIELSDKMADFISGLSENTLNISSFFIIFLATYLIFDILARLLKHAVREKFFMHFDRAGGATLGFIKGIVIASVLMIIFSNYLSDEVTFFRNSALSPFISRSSDIMMKIIPDETFDHLKAKVEDTKESW